MNDASIGGMVICDSSAQAKDRAANPTPRLALTYANEWSSECAIMTDTPSKQTKVANQPPSLTLQDQVTDFLLYNATISGL